jgi:hypothetical protein
VCGLSNKDDAAGGSTIADDVDVTGYLRTNQSFQTYF